MNSNSKQANRLANEKSPYLLQHADNPVDWFPWCDEAFEKAKRQDKPIFLSIGYSTCHWCHVMERESFENQSVADILNCHFVSVKVDREERPDVDSVYMSCVQAFTGSGGWPMSIWLTPELKPFYGGTYFPPEDRPGQIGLKTLLRRIAEEWATGREKIIASADSVIEQLRSNALSVSPGEAAGLDQSAPDRAFQQFKRLFDSEHGGFSDAPKFPTAPVLDFLLRYHARTGENEALDMALLTLRRMAGGGIRDHLGGGFHRYSVDRRWHVPHFEKMLYDQAQLACLYLDSFRITGDIHPARVAREILDYVLRDLRGSEGEFFSAEDADSPLPGCPEQKQEGAFYLWQQSEIQSLLEPEDTDIFQFVYGTRREGNIAGEPNCDFGAQNVLHLARTHKQAAERFSISDQKVTERLSQIRRRLFKHRALRPRPHLDDKAVTAWNGLMISAFARAHQVLEEKSYLKAANDAAGFIRSKLYCPESGVLKRHYRNGAAAIDGYLDDYAFLIRGLLDLYESGFDINHLKWALKLQKKQDELFEDAEGGGYFSTSGDDETILLREKKCLDGAEPSANSIAALNLLRLKYMAGCGNFQKKAEGVFTAFSPVINAAPHAVPRMLCAADFYLSGPRQIVVAGHPESAATLEMLRAIRRPFLPNKTVLLADSGRGRDWLVKRHPFIAGITSGEKAKVYICENQTCKAAAETPEELQLEELTQ